MHTGIAQSTGHFRQAHAVAAEIFVIAIAANHTTAVVPQHQPVVIGCVIAAAILDKVGQRSTVCHVLHAQTVVHQFQTVLCHPIPLAAVICNYRILPFCCAASLHDHIQVAGGIAIHDLVEVFRGKSALGFQIGSTHVQHQGIGIRSIPLFLRRNIFFPVQTADCH